MKFLQKYASMKMNTFLEFTSMDTFFSRVTDKFRPDALVSFN